MTNQEAIKNLQEFDLPRLGKDGFPNDNLKEAIGMAIAALEKEIRKEPVKNRFGEDCCPSCGLVFSDYEKRMCIPCPRCRQDINWRNVAIERQLRFLRTALGDENHQDVDKLFFQEDAE